MFTKTKHNLCASTATLDYGILLKIAEASVYSSTVKMEECIQKIQSVIVDKKSENMTLVAERISDLTYWLTIGVETVDVLKGMRTRQNVKWADLPKKEAK